MWHFDNGQGSSFAAGKFLQCTNQDRKACFTWRRKGRKSHSELTLIPMHQNPEIILVILGVPVTLWHESMRKYANGQCENWELKYSCYSNKSRKAEAHEAVVRWTFNVIIPPPQSPLLHQQTVWSTYIVRGGK